MIDKAMQKALEADGEKLRQLTGEDHGPAFGFDDDECPICGGEGFTFDCFDGCCADAEIGCDDCTRPCECNRAKP